MYLAFFFLTNLFTGNYLLKLFKVAQNPVLICCRKLLYFHLSPVKHQDPFASPSHMREVVCMAKQSRPTPSHAKIIHRPAFLLKTLLQSTEKFSNSVRNIGFNCSSH